MAKNNASQTQKNSQSLLRNIIDQAISGAARDAAELAKYKHAPTKYGQLVARALQKVQQSEHFNSLTPEQVKERARTTFQNTLKQATSKTEHRTQILQAFDAVINKRNLTPLNQNAQPTLEPIVHVSKSRSSKEDIPLERIRNTNIDLTSRLLGTDSSNNWGADGAFAPVSLNTAPLPDIRTLAQKIKIDPLQLLQLITRVDVTTPAGITALAKAANVPVATMQKQLAAPDVQKLLEGPRVAGLLEDKRKPRRLQNERGPGGIVLPFTEISYDPNRPLSPEEYVLIAMEHPDVKEAIAKRMGVKPAELTFAMQEGRLNMAEVMPHFVALAKEAKDGKQSAQKTDLSPATTRLLLDSENNTPATQTIKQLLLNDMRTPAEIERANRRAGKQATQRNGMTSSGQIFTLGDQLLEKVDLLKQNKGNKRPAANADSRADTQSNVLDFPLVKRANDSLVRIPKTTRPTPILDGDFEDITNEETRRGPPPLPTRNTTEPAPTLSPGSRQGLFDSKVWNSYNNHTWKENQTTRAFGSRLRNVLYHSMLSHEDERTREKFGSLNEKTQTKLLDDAVENIFRSNQTLARTARTANQRTWYSNAAAPSSDGTRVTPLGILAAAQLFPEFSEFQEASRNLLNISRTNEVQRNALKVMHEAVQLTHAPDFAREEDVIYGKDSYRAQPVSHRLQASRAMNGLSRATNAILRKQTQTGLSLRDIELAEVPRAGRERRTA